MDASKSLKIAGRRFQNGNYLLSLKKYRPARKEFEVALSLYEKTDAHKETAEALNNIGIILIKDDLPEEAKGFLERSYEIKKEHGDRPDSLFNTLYNILGLGTALSEEEFEKYFLELNEAGEKLGGEHADIVAREKVVYDRFVEARENKRARLLEEEQARSTPLGALEHLRRLNKPCAINVTFALHGFSINVPEFLYESNGTKIRLLGISISEALAWQASTGEMEFEEAYGVVKEFLSGNGEADANDEAVLMDESFEYIKKFMEAIAMVREDIGFCVGKRDISIQAITLKNAFGEPLELYREDVRKPSSTLTLTQEDSMLVNLMLSAQHSLYKMLLLNAKRSMYEENYSLCIVDAVAGFEAFSDLLLKKALPEAELKDYVSLENPCLNERLRFLKRLISGVDAPESSLEHYMGEVGLDVEDVLAYYDDIMGNDGNTIGAYEAGKTLKAVDRAIYNLKSLYDV